MQDGSAGGGPGGWGEMPRQEDLGSCAQAAWALPLGGWPHSSLNQALPGRVECSAVPSEGSWGRGLVHLESCVDWVSPGAAGGRGPQSPSGPGAHPVPLLCGSVEPGICGERPPSCRSSGLLGIQDDLSLPQPSGLGALCIWDWGASGLLTASWDLRGGLGPRPRDQRAIWRPAQDPPFPGMHCGSAQTPSAPSAAADSALRPPSAAGAGGGWGPAPLGGDWGDPALPGDPAAVCGADRGGSQEKGRHGFRPVALQAGAGGRRTGRGRRGLESPHHFHQVGGVTALLGCQCGREAERQVARAGI